MTTPTIVLIVLGALALVATFVAYLAAYDHRRSSRRYASGRARVAQIEHIHRTLR